MVGGLTISAADGELVTIIAASTKGS